MLFIISKHIGFIVNRLSEKYELDKEKKENVKVIIRNNRFFVLCIVGKSRIIKNSHK